jgi:hypothetical protein
MESNPMLVDVWRIKAEGAREAGEDIHHLCQHIRQWPAAQNGELSRSLAAEVADSGRMLL